MTRTRMAPGRGWAYAGVVLGGLVSIAANVTHTYLRTSAPLAIVFAFSWPVFLFVAVEILARAEWPRQFSFALVKWIGLLPVAVLAAAVSYRHLSGLLTHYGEERFVALVGPLAVDGLMIMATGALLATGHHRTKTDRDAASAAVPAVVPSTPATPTVVPTPLPSPVDTASPVPAPAVSPVPVPVPTPAAVADRITSARPASPPAPSTAVSGTGARATRTRPSRSTRTPAARLAPSTTEISFTASEAAQLALPVIPTDLLTRAAQVAAEYRTDHGTPITAGQLAVRLKVTSEQATHALAALDQAADNPSKPTPTVNGATVKAATG
jgi:hypothetical protein